MADGTPVKSVQTTIESARVSGNLLLVAHGQGGDRMGQFWFRDWQVKAGGDDLRGGASQAWGPILWTQYTLSRKVLKLTAQMVPLSRKDNRIVDLQVKAGDAWQTVGTQEIDPLSCTATFRVPDWDDSKDSPYRVVYKLKAKDGKRVFSDGGYIMDPAWVNAVQRTQTAHMPDLVDPTPIEQGITVYFTDMVYGNVSFAIIEDRKFKWGPSGAEATANPDKAVLLGERQLKFLRNWAWCITAWKFYPSSQRRGKPLLSPVSFTHAGVPCPRQGQSTRPRK